MCMCDRFEVRPVSSSVNVSGQNRHWNGDEDSSCSSSLPLSESSSLVTLLACTVLRIGDVLVVTFLSACISNSSSRVGGKDDMRRLTLCTLLKINFEI